MRWHEVRWRGSLKERSGSGVFVTAAVRAKFNRRVAVSKRQKRKPRCAPAMTSVSMCVSSAVAGAMIPARTFQSSPGGVEMIRRTHKKEGTDLHAF